MKIVSFELTMPNVGSWNGKWTGADRRYYHIRKFHDKEIKKDYPHLAKVLAKGRDSWYYNFGDGWGANVSAEIVDSKQANIRRKVSAGFCGYEWMIDSILKRGKITTED